MSAPQPPQHSPWRADFALGEAKVYFNTAGEGPLCRVSEVALERYLAEKRQPWTRRPADVFGIPAAVRETGARLLGADPAGCAFIPSVSYGMNILAQGYAWQPGDRVLLFEGEFPACVYPFLNLRQRGVQVDFCPSPGGIPDYAALPALLNRRTRMLVCSWLQFHNGYRHDLARLKALARGVDALLVVDVSQAVGLNPLDCRALGIDACLYSGHKTLCAPVGSGLFYLDPQQADRIAVSYVGWLAQVADGDFNRLTHYQLQEGLDARRFEIGSDPQLSLRWQLAMQEWFLAQGVARLQQHVLGLVEALADGLAARGCRLATGAQQRTTICAFDGPPGHDSAALFSALSAAGVVASLREGWIRLSPHAYNDGQDIERFFSALDGALEQSRTGLSRP